MAYETRRRGLQARREYQEAGAEAGTFNRMDPGVRADEPGGMYAKIRGIRPYAEKGHTAQAEMIRRAQEAQGMQEAQNAFHRGLQTRQEDRAAQGQKWGQDYAINNRDYSRGRDTVMDRRYNENRDYSRGRDKVSDSRWNEQFGRTLERDQVGDDFRNRQIEMQKDNTKYARGRDKVMDQYRMMQLQQKRGLQDSKMLPSKTPGYYESILKKMNPAIADVLGSIDSKGKYNPTEQGNAFIDAMDVLHQRYPNASDEQLVQEAARQVNLPMDELSALEQANRNEMGYTDPRWLRNESDAFHDRYQRMQGLRSRQQEMQQGLRGPQPGTMNDAVRVFDQQPQFQDDKRGLSVSDVAGAASYLNPIGMAASTADMIAGGPQQRQREQGIATMDNAMNALRGGKLPQNEASALRRVVQEVNNLMNKNSLTQQEQQYLNDALKHLNQSYGG